MGDYWGSYEFLCAISQEIVRQNAAQFLKDLIIRSVDKSLILNLPAGEGRTILDAAELNEKNELAEAAKNLGFERSIVDMETDQGKKLWDEYAVASEHVGSIKYLDDLISAARDGVLEISDINALIAKIIEKTIWSGDEDFAAQVFDKIYWIDADEEHIVSLELLINLSNERESYAISRMIHDWMNDIQNEPDSEPVKTLSILPRPEDHM